MASKKGHDVLAKLFVGKSKQCLASSLLAQFATLFLALIETEGSQGQLFHGAAD